MLDKEWLNKVALAAKVYDEQQVSGDAQTTEVIKFVEWLHRQYGIAYQPTQPIAKK
jgi:hypothetical protein